MSHTARARAADYRLSWAVLSAGSAALVACGIWFLFHPPWLSFHPPEHDPVFSQTGVAAVIPRRTEIVEFCVTHAFHSPWQRQPDWSVSARRAGDHGQGEVLFTNQGGTLSVAKASDEHVTIHCRGGSGHRLLSDRYLAIEVELDER